MEITFHPFDPELARRFAAAWRAHPGDPAAIRADLRATYPGLAVEVAPNATWHVYRDGEALPSGPGEPDRAAGSSGRRPRRG